MCFPVNISYSNSPKRQTGDVRLKNCFGIFMSGVLVAQCQENLISEVTFVNYSSKC